MRESSSEKVISKRDFFKCNKIIKVYSINTSRKIVSRKLDMSDMSIDYGDAMPSLRDCSRIEPIGVLIPMISISTSI